MPASTQATNSQVSNQVSESERSYYLEHVAKPCKTSQWEKDFRVWQAVCDGQPKYRMGVSACGGVGIPLWCNKEWCKRCGQNNSPSHQRRYFRWLKKSFGVNMGQYWVFTYPETVERILDVKLVARDIRDFTRTLKRQTDAICGFRSVDWKGDRSPRIRPHLNYFLGGVGYVSPEKLCGIKSAWDRYIVKHYGTGHSWRERAGWLAQQGCEPCPNCAKTHVVSNLSVRSGAARVSHTVRYITRPTFKTVTGDSETDWAVQVLDYKQGKLCRSFGTRADWLKIHGCQPIPDKEFTGKRASLRDPFLMERVRAGLCPFCTGDCKFKWISRCQVNDYYVDLTYKQLGYKLVHVVHSPEGWLWYQEAEGQ